MKTFEWKRSETVFNLKSSIFHQLYSTIHPNIRGKQMAKVKVKFLTGTYTLQSSHNVFNLLWSRSYLQVMPIISWNKRKFPDSAIKLGKIDRNYRSSTHNGIRHINSVLMICNLLLRQQNQLNPAPESWLLSECCFWLYLIKQTVVVSQDFVDSVQFLMKCEFVHGSSTNSKTTCILRVSVLWKQSEGSEQNRTYGITISVTIYSIVCY